MKLIFKSFWSAREKIQTRRGRRCAGKFNTVSVCTSVSVIAAFGDVGDASGLTPSALMGVRASKSLVGGRSKPCAGAANAIPPLRLTPERALAATAEPRRASRLSGIFDGGFSTNPMWLAIAAGSFAAMDGRPSNGPGGTPIGVFNDVFGVNCNENDLFLISHQIDPGLYDLETSITINLSDSSPLLRPRRRSGCVELAGLCDHRANDAAADGLGAGGDMLSSRVGILTLPLSDRTPGSHRRNTAMRRAAYRCLCISIPVLGTEASPELNGGLLAGSTSLAAARQPLGPLT
jgi:hypothetical protein